MIYGEKYLVGIKNHVTGERYEGTAVYKRASWKEWHTDNEGEGLWRGDKQVLGFFQFTVVGCKTQKAANAKVRNAAKQMMQD